MAIIPNLANAPKEVLDNITMFLDDKSIARLSGTCKKIFNFVKSCKWINDRISVLLKKQIIINPGITSLIDLTNPKSALTKIPKILHPSTNKDKTKIIMRLLAMPASDGKMILSPSLDDITKLIIKIRRHPIPAKKCTIL